jgi:hypothetical protein
MQAARGGGDTEGGGTCGLAVSKHRNCMGLEHSSAGGLGPSCSSGGSFLFFSFLFFSFLFFSFLFFSFLFFSFLFFSFLSFLFLFF